jgi:hypothetical protein
MAEVSLLIFIDYTIYRAARVESAYLFDLMFHLKYLMFIVNLLLTKVKSHGILAAEKQGETMKYE